MKVTSLMIGAAFAAGAAMSASAPAAAQDLISGIFDAIGLGPGKDPIEYRERAPLVVPPKTTLPAPQAPRTARNPAWPNDPDAAARRAAAEENNSPVIRNEDPMMSPRALRAGPRTNSDRYTGLPIGAAPENSNSDLIIGPTFRMRAADTQREALNNLNPGEEPQRKSLSEPPAGYRKPTEIVRSTRDPTRTVDTSSTRDFALQRRQ
jgi:hypothetical protein